MASGPREKFDNPVIEWVDSRLPLFTMMKKEYGVFPTPKNFNYFWNFGAIASVLLVVMIITGILLAMNYAPHTSHAFDSVERIMRDVNGGWLIRYIHMNGASFFFIAVYIHIFRGMYYGSYKKPRELLWMLGVAIFLIMMATAFMGYVLPWGQMSYWGATVITNLFSAIPLVGNSIVTWLWGGFSVDNPTLNRFFALHYLLPFVIFAVVFLHVWALHVTGSNNPDGVEPKTAKDTVPFHPYYTMKDSYGLLVFLIVFCAFIFFAPDRLGHPDNYTPANPLVTPAHIVPEWYFLPFYAMLRAVTFNIGIPFTDIVLIPAKLGGVIAMFGSIALLFALPFLDTHPVKSARYRPQYRFYFLLLFVIFVFLGYAGSQPADAAILGIPMSSFALAATGYYYAFFIVVLPYLSRKEIAREVPKSIDAAVTERKAKKSKKASVKSLFMALALAGLFLSTSAQASGGEADPLPEQEWHFNGVFGTFDQASMQRGLKVYREVCAACHSLKRVRYGNLVDLGYDENQAKAIAGEYTVTDGPNDEGEMFTRPARTSDAFVSPYPNDKAAKAMNKGALPPDLSLITKARHHGPDYVYGILTGYTEAPHGHVLMDGQHWNKYMPGHVIAMPPPLTDGVVAFEDETPQTVEQYAHDVVNFLVWAADPYMPERKRTGIKVILFLLAFAGVMYAVKKKVWADLKK